MNGNYLLYGALVAIAALAFFVPVPDKNMELVKTIVTALIAGTVGFQAGRSMRNGKNSDRSNAAS